MRAEIKTVDGEVHEGSVLMKDESFVFIRGDVGERVTVIHWSWIAEDGVKRIIKGKPMPVNLDLFRKARE